MNILFLSQIVPYPPHGGVLQRGYNILREIGRYNRVHLLAFHHPDTLGTPDLIRESRKELEKYCVTVRYFPLWPKRSIVHKLAAFGAGLLYPLPFSVLAHRSSAYRNAVRETLDAHSIDLLHVDTIGLAPYRQLAPEIPCVLTHHNIESRLMERRAETEDNPLRKFYTHLQARRLRAYEASQSPSFDMNIMVSKNDLEELSCIAPGIEAAVIPNGVDTSYFSPSVDNHEIAAIYTGGMNMYANRDAVLYFIRDIWPAILRAHPEAKFYAIGQDPPRELQEYAARDSSIIVTGFVDDVRPYVRKCAVYVVPLRVGGGTRLKVLDALAQGKAIVSTSVGCEGIAVTSGRDIVIEDEPARFSARVSALFSDAAMRRQLGIAARQLTMSRYDWSAIGQDLQNLYQNIVEQKPSAGGIVAAGPV